MSGGLLIGGDFFLNPKDTAGNPTGLIGPLNTTRMQITHPEPEAIVRESRRKATLGQALDTVYIGKPDTIEIAIDDQPKAMLEMLFSAVSEAVSVAGGSVTDEALTIIPDRWTRISKKNLTAASEELATVAAPAVPLVKGTDYEINYEAGLIKGIVGGAIATATACLLDYDHAAVAGTRYNGSRRTSVKTAIFMEGVNKVDNSPCFLEVDEAELYSSEPIDFAAGQQYVTTVLKGVLATLAGQDEPYRYEALTFS